MTTTDAHARLYESVRTKSFVKGHVVLASGKESDHYFDMKPTMFDPEGAELLAELIYARIAETDTDIVGGLEMGAVPLITPVSIVGRRAGRTLPGFFVRKTVKDHGTKKLIDGLSDVSGKRVAIVEDVDAVDAVMVGRLVRHHADLAPLGTNVNFVQSAGHQALKIRTYERGVEAETLSC